MGVPQEILNQLGGGKFVAMTGASQFVGDRNTLRMKLPKNASRANRLWITLNGLDLYDMRFFRYTSPRLNRKTYEFVPEKIEEVKTFNNVYCDMLQELFTEVTHMRTHL